MSMDPKESNTTASPSSTSTTLAEMQQWVDRFAEERKWERFHTPKNLAMSIAIEAAEIMELFQWSESTPLDGPLPPD